MQRQISGPESATQKLKRKEEIKMNTTETQTVQRTWTESVLSGGGTSVMAEAIGAIGALVLAIIGLAGVLPNLMASIATIVIGADLLAEGCAIGARYRHRFAQSAVQAHGLQGTGYLAGEFIGGTAGIVLGILALFRADPTPMLAVAVLVFGATLLISGAATRSQWFVATQAEGAPREVAAASAPSGHMLVGLGAVVLGILAVIGLVPMTLILVGLLSLGAALGLIQLRLP